MAVDHDCPLPPELSPKKDCDTGAEDCKVLAGHINGVPQLVNIVVVKTVTVTRGLIEHVDCVIVDTTSALDG